MMPTSVAAGGESAATACRSKCTKNKTPRTPSGSEQAACERLCANPTRGQSWPVRKGISFGCHVGIRHPQQTTMSSATPIKAHTPSHATHGPEEWLRSSCQWLVNTGGRRLVLGVCVVNCRYPTRLIPSVESAALVGNTPHRELLPKPLKKLVAGQHIGVVERNMS